MIFIGFYVSSTTIKANLGKGFKHSFYSSIPFSLRPSHSSLVGRGAKSILPNGAERISHQFGETHFCGVRMNWNGNDDKEKKNFARIFILYHQSLCSGEKYSNLTTCDGLLGISSRKVLPFNFDVLLVLALRN